MAVPERVEIGGVTYSITKYDAFTALEILGDLQKQFLAPLLSVLDGKEAGNPEAVTAGLIQGVERVMRDMDGKRLRLTAERLLFQQNVGAVRPGEEPRKLGTNNWHEYLTDVADLLELCVEVVKTNFSSVFQRAANLFGAAQALSPTLASRGLPTSSLPN